MQQHEKPSSEDITRWNRAFKFRDLDGSNSLDHDEIVAAVMTAGYNIPKRRINELIAKFDSDNTGTLELDEYIDMMQQLQSEESGNLEEQNEQLEQAFNAIDADHNQVLTRDELIAALVGVGDDDFTEEDVDDMIKMVDTNKDGVLDIKEYLDYMSKREKELRETLLQDANPALDSYQ